MNSDTITQINNYMKKFPWMDFEMCRFGGDNLQLFGCIDELGRDKVIIEFDMPYMVCSTLSFTYEGDGEFISIVDGEKAYSINTSYGITQGNTLYEIRGTNIPHSMFIAANNVSFTVC